MKQLLLGAALVGALSLVQYPQILPKAQPMLSSPLLVVNQAMLCGTYPSLAKVDGSYMPITGEYGRVTWTR